MLLYRDLPTTRSRPFDQRTRRAVAWCPRRPLSRSPPPQRLPGSAGRTWCRVGWSPGSSAGRERLSCGRSLSWRSTECLVGKRKVDGLHLEQPLILLYKRVLRFREDALKRWLVKVLKGGDHR